MPTIARSGSAVTTPASRLASRWHAAIRDGDGWDTAHRTSIQVLNAAARDGWTWDGIVALYDSSALYNDAYLTRSDNGRRRGATSAFNLFRDDWLNAVNLIEHTPPIVDKVGAYAALYKIRHLADTHQWTGRSGLRDHIVLNALLAVADTLGTINPQVSVRTLTEDTPYRNNQVVSSALRSLAHQGWLTADRAGLHRTDPSIYRLRTPTPELGRYVRGQDIALLSVGTSANVRTTLAERVTPSEGVQATRLAMALTPHRQAVYATLTGVPQSRNQIAKMSGVSRPTTSRALPALALAGLARDVVGPDGRSVGWTRGATDPGDVVFERGIEGKEEARRARHESERKQWKSHCEGRMSDKQKAMVRADALNRKADAEALRNLAKRPPKPRPKWREDAAPFNEAVRASLGTPASSPERLSPARQT